MLNPSDRDEGGELQAALENVEDDPVEFILEYSVTNGLRTRFRVRPRRNHDGAWLYEEECDNGEWETIGRAPIDDPIMSIRDLTSEFDNRDGADGRGLIE